MTIIRFSKDKISIKNIGRQRFWIGISAGLISAVSISLFFNYSREALRFLTYILTDLLILKPKELRFFDYFFTSLASTLGLSVTIWIWMSNNDHKRSKDRLYKQVSRANTQLIFWLFIFVISRFGSVLLIGLFNSPGYDNHLNLYEDYWIIFVIIPIVVFMQNWLTVRMVYRAEKWIFVSLIFCALTTFALKATTTVDQEKLNRSYNQRFEKDFQFIDQTIKTASAAYGVEFDTETIDVLKKWHTEGSQKQVMRVKMSFTYDQPVTMDTIILEKIIIRNFKQGGWYLNNIGYWHNWHYAEPKDILKQIYLSGKDSDQTKELFEILKEQINLVNTPAIDWDDHGKYTETERRKGSWAEYRIPKQLLKQLQEVRDSLSANDKYSDYLKGLPEINERD